MRQEDLFEIIIRKYYAAIYRYCFYRLNQNEEAAKDCTQETFLKLIEKKQSLDLTGNIEGWLYKTAQNVIKHHLRDTAKTQSCLNINQLLNTGAEDPNLVNLLQTSILDCLTPQESELVKAYCNAERGKKSEIADQFGITLCALYNEISRIKKKILSNNQQNFK